MSDTATLRAEVGRLNWRLVRNLVLIMQHEGSDIQVTEGSGFLSRPFLFRGSADDLARVQHYFQCLEAA